MMTVPRAEKAYERRLQVGRAIIVVVGILFMILAVVIGPLFGEDAEFAGLTFEELQATNPRLADVVWHTNTGLSSLVVGVNLLVVLLAWRGLSSGSRLAWYSILILSLTFAVGVLAAHVPIYIRHPSYTHWVLPLTLAVVQLVGLAITVKPVFSTKQEG